MTDFAALDRALTTAGVDHPALILDLAAVRHNLDHLAAALPRGYQVRVAEKSLPVPGLLTQVMARLGTDRIMSFHLGMTRQTYDHFPKADVMMGKPMPATEAARFMAERPERPLWLIDNADRAAEYAALCDRFGPLDVAVEVDIGLGRGGFATPQDIALPHPLRPVAIMGYEAHVSALPRLLGRGPRAQTAAMARLAAFRAALPDAAIINTGGSTTALHLPEGGPGNELVIGSAVVKPADFDQPVNAPLIPALWIAAPVLKRVAHGLPGHPRLSRMLRKLRLIAPEIAFLYGGKWMARPHWPQPVRHSPFYPASSNQEGLCLPLSEQVTNRVILRPTQSEAVMMQFATLYLYDQGAITGQMTPFDRV